MVQSVLEIIYTHGNTNMSKDDNKLTPKQIMSRIYSINRGILSPAYIAKELRLQLSKDKKKKGGTIKK